MDTLRRYWFLAALALVIPLGLFLPEGGSWLRSSGLLPYFVAATLFISGWMIDGTKLRAQASNWQAVILTLGTTYTVAPLLAYFLASITGPENTGPPSKGYLYLEAILIAAAQASTLSSAIALTVVSRGNQELALVLTLTSNLLTAILTPFILELGVGAEISLPVLGMMQKMALVILLPAVAGQILRRILHRGDTSRIGLIRRLPQFIILIFVYSGFGAAAEHLTEDLGLAFRFLGTCAALHVTLLAWTLTASRLLRLDRGTRAAVVFCGSQKTLPNGIYIWERFFAQNPYGAIPIVLYHVFQLLVDTLIVPWLSPEADKKDSREA